MGVLSLADSIRVNSIIFKASTAVRVSPLDAVSWAGWSSKNTTKSSLCGPEVVKPRTTSVSKLVSSSFSSLVSYCSGCQRF